MARDRLRTTLAGFLLAAAVIVVLAWLVGIDDVVGSLQQADRSGVATVAALIVGLVACWGLGMRAVLRSYDAVAGSIGGQLIVAAAAVVAVVVVGSGGTVGLWRRRRGLTTRCTDGLTQLLDWFAAIVLRFSAPDRADCRQSGRRLCR